MSSHVTRWLHAYLDGELHGDRLQAVQTHLADCAACLAEMESLERLSDLLQEIPVPEFSPPERFAAQVSLRLPRPRRQGSGRTLLEVGWWMIPVGLMGFWFFTSALFLFDDLVSVATTFGFLTTLSDWASFSPWGPASWSSALGQTGILSGSTLEFAASMETLTRTSLPQIGLQISIALLYLSWMAIWWARHRRQESGQLLEG